MRKTPLMRWQRQRLRDMGIDPADVGRIVNRTQPAVAPKSVHVPTNAAELESMLGDEKALKELFTDKSAFGEFISNYARVVLDRDQSIATQVREETQRVLADYLRENQPELIGRVNLDPGVGVPSISRQRNSIYNARAMGAKIDKEFANSAEYFTAIWHNANRDAALQAKLQRMRNAFSSTVPSEGGFLIPESLRSELLSVALETSIVRSRARVIPMETARVPFPAIDATSHTSSVFGGIIAYWTEEGAAMTPSEAKFSRIVLDAKKLTAYTEAPNEMISDSVLSFQAFIDTIFPEALAFYEDDAFLNGSGVGMPLGVMNAGNAGAVEVAKESSQAADTIVWENIVKMYARMLPGSLARAVWIVSPDTFPELATMALSVGTGGSAIWLNNGASGPPMTILGRPVIVSEKAPKLGDAGDISFVDFGFYLVGDRQVMSALSSPHYRFGNDVTAYRIIERVDGQPWLRSAITPKNNGATLSAYVKLAERA